MAQPTTAFGNSTLAQMRAAVYGAMRRDSSDPVKGLGKDEVKGYIAKWDAFFVDSARWNFQGFRKVKIVESKVRTDLSSDYTKNDLTLTVTSNAGATAAGGRLTINRDEIDYEGKVSTTVITIHTGTDKLDGDVDHEDGEFVEYLVAAPDDFGKPGEMWLMDDSGNVGGAPMTHQDWRGRYAPSSGRYFYKDGYIYLPHGTPASRLQLNYWKKGMKLSADADNLQTPQNYEDFVKWCAMAECYIALKEFDEADKMFALAGVTINGDIEPVGLLTTAMGRDSVQTDSENEIFEAAPVPLNASFG